MAWVRGIKQASMYQPEREGRDAIPKPIRVINELPLDQVERTVRSTPVELPLHRGAGPCGTLARRCSGRSYAIWWSVHHLVGPVRSYYATYVPPMRFGAKSTPRGRRVA